MKTETGRTGATVVVEALEHYGVEYVFGIPGAKIDSVFNALASSSMKTIVCRHEQNAAFIAGGIGRLTGRLKLNLVHMIWIDQHYDMVEVQEQAKYGRASGVDFGPIDVVKYTEAFGARGSMISSADEIAQVLHKAFEMPGPVLIGIPVDYRDNHLLFETSPSIC